MAKPMILVLNFILIFSVESYYYCDFERNIIEFWTRNTTYTPCCEITAEQWEFISWYFIRVGSHIDVTEIVREKDLYTSYSNPLLTDLYDYTGLKARNYRVDYSFVEEIKNSKTLKKIHEWHPELSKYGNTTYYMKDNIFDFRNHILKRNWNREDEPSKGSIVLASEIDIIDHYLNQVTRQPFVAKRAHFLIIIYREINDKKAWDKYASSILTKLWKVHGILNAIIFSTCHSENVCVFSTFF